MLPQSNRSLAPCGLPYGHKGLDYGLGMEA